MELKKEIFYGYRIILPIVVFMALGIYFLRDFAILILFSDEFIPMSDLFFYQLIGDVFKIASWLLGYLMIAKATGLKAGDFVHTLGDAHLYSNHLEQADLQLSREPFPLPGMEINPDVSQLDDFRYEDFKILDYQCHAGISAPIAV